MGSMPLQELLTFISLLRTLKHNPLIKGGVVIQTDLNKTLLQQNLLVNRL